MTNSIEKKLLVSALSLTIVCACSTAPLAMGYEDFFESGAERYAQTIEDIVDQAGDAYEDNVENFDDNAETNPFASFDFLERVGEISNGFESSILGSTDSYIESIFSTFKR